MIVPVILAGGSGTRLWPMSRELYPKQLIDIYNEYTMLQNTVLRLEGLEQVCAPIVVCNEDHRFMTAEQFHQIKTIPTSILLEPIGRNTAPAIALAALKAMEIHSDPTLLVLPADHVIENIGQFHKAVQLGAGFAESGKLITFGIIPNAPKTGYGYIKKGAVIEEATGVTAIECFVEKPDEKTAQAYLDSGEYCWNSGMFMFTASQIISQLDIHSPGMVAPCKNAIENGVSDLDFFRLSLKDFEKLPSDSIDYAVMEKTTQGAMIPIDAGWNDLGSFDALWQTGQKDTSENVIKGDVITSEVTASYINSDSRLVAAVGLENVVIVETRDAVLVSPRDRVQDVKKSLHS